MQNQKYLKLRQLVEETGLSYYKLIYLRDIGKLPIIRESQGRGYPTYYHPDSIKVVKDHIAKSEKCRKSKSISSLLVDLIQQVNRQILEMPVLPSYETTIKINKLKSLRDFLIVEIDKWNFDNGN